MIHERIKQLRENAKMNKKDFAAFLGIKYTTYNNYETGAREPSSDFLILISKKFDISIDYLMGLSEDKDISHSYTLKTSEIKHIEKYRDLDPHGVKIVDFVLEEEYSRSISVKKVEFTKSAQQANNAEAEHIKPIAAHNDNESNAQQRLMRNDLDKLNKLNEH